MKPLQSTISLFEREHSFVTVVDILVHKKCHETVEKLDFTGEPAPKKRRLPYRLERGLPQFWHSDGVISID